ncbi:MAG TPA: glycosyltransferase family 9 protein [Stellaceae bacterium]|nr:glycosyltransferase family 9 protein [Stellaceae bacterium]
MEGLFGAYEEIRTSGLFDPEYYLAAYPDVAARNLDPLVHYLEEGAREGRNPHPDFDSAFYLEQCRRHGEQPENPLLHYLRVGEVRGFKTKPEAAPGRQEAEPTQRPPILVAIEMIGVLGTQPGCSRVSIAGWALASSPISGIDLSLGGEFAAAAFYGLARPDIVRLHPERAGAGRCGFLLAVDIANRGRSTIEPVLAVRTADGAVARRPVRIEIPPQELEVAAIDPLAEEVELAAADSRPPMRLRIEHTDVDAAGILRLSGWVVACVQIERVEASLDGVPLGAAAVGTVRPDIETAWPDYPNGRFSGFALAAATGRGKPGSRRLVVRASGRAGVACEAVAELALPAFPEGAAGAADTGFQCHVEESSWAADGRLVVTGWAVGPAPVQSASVLIGDREAGHARIGSERPEIGNLFPTMPHARFSGFALVERVPRIAGKHRASLAMRCTDGATYRHDLRLRGEAAPEMRLGSAVGDADRRLHIDAPVRIDGALPAPVRGDLEIGGWAVARQGVAAVEIAIDGRTLARAELGQRRLDVRAAYPDWPGSAASGFHALLPGRILPKGAHALSVILRDTTGRTVATEFRIEVAERTATGPWSLRRQMPPAEAALGLRIIESRGSKPSFAALLPVAGDEESIRRARLTIASLQAQVYPDWRLLLAAKNDDAARLAALDERIALMPQALPASGEHEFLTVLTAGDELGADAFLELALAAAVDAEADFLYSDERRPDPATGIVEAFFKPDWSPDLLLATNYIGRLWCARGDLVRRIAGAEPLLGNGEYDLVLRCTEAAAAIRHLPMVLCERTVEPAAADEAALDRAISRRGIAGEVRAGLIPGSLRVQRRLVRPGLVSIIIPTCAAGGMIENCIASLRRLTAYPDYEIVCIENIPPGNRKWRNWLRRHADRVISTKESFNWSRFNNRAAAEAKGEYLLFLNDDVEITDPGWLEAMLEEAQRPEVGVVGPRLLYPDGRVQHAGMFLAAMGQARHAFRHAAGDDPGYFGLALTRRNVVAVTGACLLTRRETLEALGGFDEAHAIVNNDLDFCLRAWRSGLWNIYTPHATLIHHEAASRSELPDTYDAAAFDRKWRDLFLGGDPFFSPHLARDRDGFTIDDEPTRLSVVGRPALPRAAIRKILALKLDHIGDCITAFPALRRLRRAFPEARITVLTSPASRPVWAWEPGVDDTIEFEFFHPRSDFGEHKHSDEAWDTLRARLAPERFDLAIDLRKHPETRPVLRHAGARFLAGFDFRSQFPWLDVALDWGGDQIYARKHQHVSDDLVNLVDAVAAACEEARQTIVAAPPPDAAAAALAAGLPGAGPLVCVHPAAGSAIRQWPVAGFAWVIDRLVAEYDARVVLVGAPAEEETAEAVRRLVCRPERVASLIGILPLAGLPGLLAGCALFLGNNSGPKHLAAGLGVPTVGVHGGTVDVREWGPVGPAAVAVSREVACSPCYLPYAEECPRGVVCLAELAPVHVYEACRRLLLPRRPAPEALPLSGPARPG